MSKEIRVRFAPSPTGPLHIGGVRTALFNYLFAKKNQGKFILRIEDTDRNRYVPGAEDYIIEALEWCGIPFDEGPGKEGPFGPYRQSERKETYRKYADELIARGKAYYAFDTQNSLDAHRRDHELQGKTFIYNWHNRMKLRNSLALGPDKTAELIDSGEPYVVRFLSPENETLHLKDIIRGDIQIDSKVLDDKVLFKSDGMPTYHLANVVDDHLMEITHVIRGEEWLPSLALHHLLYWAFEWQTPEFAHLPLILKPTGKGKLSKRDGERMGFPVYPLTWEKSVGYREAGYFPETVINFLALLGWNPGTEDEIFSLEELVSAFDLSRVHKAGARFDPEKTKWYNHHYLQQESTESLVADFLEYLKGEGALDELPKESYLRKVVPLLKERATFVSDLWETGHYFFIPPEDYDEKAARKHWRDDTPKIMRNVLDLITDLEAFDAGSIEGKIKGWIQENQLGFGKIMPPLRLALVGGLKGPGLFEIMELIGKEECLSRINRAIGSL